VNSIKLHIVKIRGVLLERADQSRDIIPCFHLGPILALASGAGVLGSLCDYIVISRFHKGAGTHWARPKGASGKDGGGGAREH
jgi:hypothetical protein